MDTVVGLNTPVLSGPLLPAYDSTLLSRDPWICRRPLVLVRAGDRRYIRFRVKLLLLASASSMLNFQVGAKGKGGRFRDGYELRLGIVFTSRMLVLHNFCTADFQSVETP